MEIEIVCFSNVFALLLGKSSFKALGLTSVEVSIKKMSNRKTMSVMEDILKLALTLFLLLNPIIRYGVKGPKIQLFLLLA